VGFRIERDVLDDLDPYKEQPHGDRYIVEEAEIGNEKIIEGRTLFVAADVGYWEYNPLNGQKKWIEGKTFEEVNGYFIGRVVAKGNGHRLERDEVVPMSFEVGDVLRIERFTGRKWTFNGVKYRLVNQVDCLSLIPELSPQRIVHMDGRVERVA
jgi:co-chaperonin GroES (HSP10)